jgi:hypothetical protein
MTTITLDLSPELAQQLHAEAARQGMEPDRYILDTLQDRLRSNVAIAQPTEADLLQQINIGFSAQDWEIYHGLIAKRRAETLTAEEYERLVMMSDRLEKMNVARVRALIQLAALRNQPLTDLMQSLGINPETEALDYV